MSSRLSGNRGTRSGSGRRYSAWLVAICAGSMLIPSTASAAVPQTPTSAPVAAIQSAEPGALGNPIDRFENRRSVGTQGLIFANGPAGRYDVHRLNLEEDLNAETVNPPRMLSDSKALDHYNGGSSDYQWQTVEADLDMIAYPDGVKRPSLEPGIATAGRGYCGSAQGPFCVFWTRPLYDANHKLQDDRRYTYSVAIPGQPPRTGSEVDIVAGRFGDDLEKSLMVAWVDTDGDVMVAHVYAERGYVLGRPDRVTNLTLAGTPVALGKALPGTSPSLAVGDIQASGSDQVAAVWAPDSSTPTARRYAAALIDVDPQRQVRQAVPSQTLAPLVFPGGSDTQVSPGAAVLRDTRGSGPTKNRLIIGPGIRNAGHLEELRVNGGAFERFEYLLTSDTGGILATDSYRSWHSDIESLGDIDGDGLDDLVAAPKLRDYPYGLMEIISLGDVPGGQTGFRVLASADTEPTINVTVLDARPTDEQAIAPVPGRIRVDKLPQIGVSSSWAPGCSGGQRKAVFNLVNLNYNSQTDKWSIGTGVQQDLSSCSAQVQIPRVASFALDGRAELGEPVKGGYTTLEPAVILNAPPTHFDVLDGRMYDPNFCYAGNQYAVPPVCFFDSSYKLEQAASTEVTSESSEDWAVSATASTEFSLFDVVKVEAEIRGGYGEKYTNIGGTTTTDKIEVKVKALNTDKIYAIRRAYDTLEYPIYQPGGTRPSGYVMSTTPHTVSKRWIDINSPDAVNLNVNHQPGNILSYPEDISAAENPFISPSQRDANSPLISTFADNQEFELSDSSSYSYTLTQEKVTNKSAATAKDWNVGATLKGSGNVAGLVEVSVEVKGDYKNSQLTNTKTTIGDTTELAATLAGIDESFGETAYTVKPFAYWNESAALVLDYAVSPGVAPPGAPRTWWQQKYGFRPDLTLKLPRLLDDEKQAGISTDAARFISPGVQIFRGPCTPNDPLVLTPDYAEPLSPLCVRAQVENYSLKDQQGNTSVEFYDADPDVGGRLLGSVDDVDPVAARDSQFVYFDWTPDAKYAGSAPRIFARVDSGNAVAEIHEDNNKGYRMYRAVADADIAPRAPEDVFAEAGPGRTLSIDWADPLSAVQPASHQWRVVVYPDAGGAPIETVLAGDQLSTSISEVPPGRYRVAVFSVDGGASSPASHPSEPVDVASEAPGAPSNVVGIPGDESIVLQWDAPASSGGVPVETYRIREVRQQGDNYPQTPIDTTVSGTTTALTLSGLANGRAYRFTVQAINAAAPGEASVPSAPVTPLGVPEKATDVKAQRGGPGTAKVTWDAPATSAARSAVTGYDVEVSPGGTVLQVPGSALEAVVPGLQTGVTYTFTVRPMSASGPGPLSEKSNPLTLPDAPSPPRNVKGKAAADPGSATVTWIPPISTGGVPIDRFRGCAVGGECRDESGTSQQSTFTGLPRGVPVVFTVRARNEAGLESPEASSPEVSLAVAPDIVVTRGPSEGSFTGPEATIEFATSFQGAEVTCFIDGVGQTCSSPLRLTGLTDGKHTFRAKATAAGGTASTGLLSWLVDSQEPKATIDDFPVRARKGIPRLRYSGGDRGGSGLAAYEIRTKTNGIIGSFSNPVTITDPSTAGERTRRLKVERGKTVCASVRAIDQVGNRSGWSQWRCASRPLDQSALKASGSWRPVKGRFFSVRSALRAVNYGSALSVLIGRSDGVSVAAVACSDCGRLEVRHRGQLLRVIDLSTVGAGRSGSAAGRHVKEFAVDWPESARGYLRLVSLGGGPVIVDGVTVQRRK